MFKKVFTFTIIGMIGAGVLAGCGGAASEQVVEMATTVTESVTLAAAKDEGSLAQSDSEVTTTSTTSQVTSSDYILPDSDKRLLTESDLAGLSNDELRLARNEIFARHGRKFKDSELSAYFNAKGWYNGTVEADTFDSDTGRYLNETELKNVALIKKMENQGASDEGSKDAQITINSLAASLRNMTYGELRQKYGNIIEATYAAKYEGTIPGSNILVIYEGTSDAGNWYIDDSYKLNRVCGKLSDVFDGVANVMSGGSTDLQGLANALTRSGGGKATYNIAEGTGTHYYINATDTYYAVYFFDDDGDGVSERKMAVDANESKRVTPDTDVWLYSENDGHPL